MKEVPPQGISEVVLVGLSTPLASSALLFDGKLSLRPNQVAVVFLGGGCSALRGGTTCTEVGHKGTVLAAQHDDVRIGLIQAVVELRWLQLLNLLPCSLNVGAGDRAGLLKTQPTYAIDGV